MNTSMDIVQEHRKAVAQVADRYFERFEREVSQKTHKEVWDFIHRHELAYAEEVTDMTMRVLSDNHPVGQQLFHALKENCKELSIGLSARIQIAIGADAVPAASVPLAAQK